MGFTNPKHTEQRQLMMRVVTMLSLVARPSERVEHVSNLLSIACHIPNAIARDEIMRCCHRVLVDEVRDYWDTTDANSDAGVIIGAMGALRRGLMS